MKIIVTGGGSGGHITPILAVSTEIKKQVSDAEILYIGQRSDRVAAGVGKHHAIDKTKYIWAGKLRRYHGVGWKQFLDVKTMFFNIRDVFYTIMGIIQSVWVIGFYRPEAVFIKGGFVSVPVGLAAAFWRIPYITHDSDAVAGLANRVVARWATLHAVGLPEETYNYPKSKTKTVGVPIASEYKKVLPGEISAYKTDIGLPAECKLVFITGGGLGAQVLNEAAMNVAASLLKDYPDLYIVHLTGYKKYKVILSEYEKLVDKKYKSRLIVRDFVSDLYRYSGAADIVVTRAGATALAEFAMQAKACIIVPNPFLAGGHQLHNAVAYEKAGAAIMVKEFALGTELGPSIRLLLDDSATIQHLGDKLHKFANPNAAKDLADLILKLANQKSNVAK